MITINFESIQTTHTKVEEYLDGVEVLDATDKNSEDHQSSKDKSKNKTKTYSNGYKFKKRNKKSPRKMNISNDLESPSDSKNDHSKPDNFCYVYKVVGGHHWTDNSSIRLW